MTTSDATPANVPAPRRWAGGLAFLVMLGGLTVLVGWGWNVPLLKSALPGQVNMKANAALGFVLAGAALTLLAGNRPRRLRSLANVCILAMMLLGTLTAVEFASGYNLGIDQLLFKDPAGGLGTLPPGRMTPLSALAFILLAVTLLLAQHPRTLAMSQRLAVLVAVLGMVPLSGKIYGSPLATGLGYCVQMAAPTALLFVFAGLAAFHLHPDAGVHRFATPASLGGRVIRRMLPFVIGVPLLLGWFHEIVSRAGYYDDPLGDALLMLVIMLLQIIMLWWTASTVTRLDLQQQKTEADLRTALAQRQESDDQFKAVVHASQDAIQLIDSNCFIDCNAATLRMFGCQNKQEIVGVDPAKVSPPCQPDGRPSAEKAGEMMALAFQKGFHRFEWVHRRADGTDFPAEIWLTAIVVGGHTQLHAVIHDATAARQQTELLHRLSQAVEQTPAAVVITDTTGAIQYVNGAFSELTGYALNEVLQKNPRILQSGLTPRDSYLSLWGELRAGRTWRGELLNKDKNGKLFWEFAVISPLRDAQGNTTHYLAVKENITARKVIEQELHASRLKLDQAMNLSHLANWEYEVATDRFLFDERFYGLYATTLAREGGDRMASADYARNFVHPDDQHLVVQEIALALKSSPPDLDRQVEHRIVRRDGKVRHILTRFVAVRSPEGRIVTLHGANQDITERKEIEEALHAKTALFEAQVNASLDGIVVVDNQNRRIITNHRLRELFQEREMVNRGAADDDLLHHAQSLMKDPEGFLQRVQELYLHPLESSREELELVNGVILDRYSAPVLGADGRHYGRIWAFRDITAQKAMEAELRAAASVDKLTGLSNRALLCDRLQQTILRAQRLKGYHFAVLFLDMDRFKLINDSLGHDVGDLMLQEIARRLNAAIRIGDSLGRPEHWDTTARLGGDEFVILLDALKDPADATRVAARMLDVLAEPYRLREHDIYSTASIGIVTSDMAAESAEQILRDADTAMYEAKLAGKGRYAVFGAPMRQRVQQRLNIETDLRKAINTDQFHLVYEPIVSLATGDIERFEALLRWKHPQRGLIMPGEFILIAEETGMILALGDWVLRTACRQFARWRATLGAGAPRSISVNLSRTQLLLRDLPFRLHAILHETAMPADCLHLEVTESAVMRDAAGAARTLRAIKDLGVKLDIDDFGTGYSSLACLHEFPLDVLKIDRSFVANIERGRDFAALVHAVTQLARNLNIQVVGEGVETVDQALILQAHDCDFGQGYFFSRPMDPDAAARFRVDASGWNASHPEGDAPGALNSSAL